MGVSMWVSPEFLATWVHSASDALGLPPEKLVVYSVCGEWSEIRREYANDVRNMRAVLVLVMYKHETKEVWVKVGDVVHFRGLAREFVGGPTLTLIGKMIDRVEVLPEDTLVYAYVIEPEGQRVVHRLTIPVGGGENGC